MSVAVPKPYDNGRESTDQAAPRGRRGLVYGALFILILTVWQSGFLADPGSISDREDVFRLDASVGIYGMDRFVYFYYHLGLFPVMLDSTEDLEDSPQAAQRYLETRSDSILMEVPEFPCIQYGELGRILLYMPAAFLRGTAQDPKVWPFHAFLFQISLVVIFLASCHANRRVLGLLLILFLGSNPYQLYEVYCRNNLHSLSITTFALMYGIWTACIYGSTARWYLVAASVFSGFYLGTLTHIRTEPVTVLGSIVLVMIANTNLRTRFKGALIGALLSSFFLAMFAWQSYFDFKYEQAQAVVIKVGGHRFPGPRLNHHMLWHNLWMGFSDHDRKYGHKWDDRAGADRVRDELRSSYGIDFPESDQKHYFWPDLTWDEAGKYPKLPYAMPEYARCIRQVVLWQIQQDPLWFCEIIFHRIIQTFTMTTPLRITTSFGEVELPLSRGAGLLLFPVCVWLFWRREFGDLLTVVFFLPLSATAILVTSSKGALYISCYHIAAAAVAIFHLLTYFKVKLAHSGGRPAHRE